MKPHPRIRTAVKWGGSITAMLVLSVWILSRWWYVQVSDASGRAADVALGQIFIDTNSSFGLPPIGGTRRFDRIGEREYFHWWFGGTSMGNYREFHVPLWALSLPFAASAVFAW